MKLLFIDDDDTLRRALGIRLADIGYEMLTAASGHEGLRLAFEARPDLVILDVMMPEMDGWETCRRLRQMSQTPILFLTGKGAEEDVLRGLMLGADDFMRKPFSFRELELRIAAILHRSQAGVKEKPAAVFDDGNLRIDLERRLVYRSDQPVHLTPTEFSLLAYLVVRRGRVTPHAEILRMIWGPEYEHDAGVLTVYIRYLREKLEDDPGRPRYIINERGLGYRFSPLCAS